MTYPGAMNNLAAAGVFGLSATAKPIALKGNASSMASTRLTTEGVMESDQSFEVPPQISDIRRRAISHLFVYLSESITFMSALYAE
jgi:hypothetical protein